MDFFAPLLDFVRAFWPHLVFGTSILSLVLMVVASGHIVLYKRDTRAAIGWIGIVLLVPLVGSTLYFMFGINRLHRRARSLRSDSPATPAPPIDL